MMEDPVTNLKYLGRADVMNSPRAPGEMLRREGDTTEMKRTAPPSQATIEVT